MTSLAEFAPGDVVTRVYLSGGMRREMETTVVRVTKKQVIINHEGERFWKSTGHRVGDSSTRLMFSIWIERGAS